MSAQAANIVPDWGAQLPSASVVWDSVRPGTFVVEGFRGNAATSERLTALDEIARLGTLDYDWDGYGGLPMSSITCQNASAAIMSFPEDLSAPEISPNSNGTITFDWASDYGDASLELGKTKFSFFIKFRSGQPLLVDGSVCSFTGIGEAIKSCLYPSPPASTLQLMVVSVDRLRYPALCRW